MSYWVDIVDCLNVDINFIFYKFVYGEFVIIDGWFFVGDVVIGIILGVFMLDKVVEDVMDVVFVIKCVFEFVVLC